MSALPPKADIAWISPVVMSVKCQKRTEKNSLLITLPAPRCGPRSVELLFVGLKSSCVMVTFLKIFIVVVLALAFIGWLADRRAAANRPHVTPGLSFLPGDIKYESPNGNVRVYFPIVTSIVLSVLLTLILRFFS